MKNIIKERSKIFDHPYVRIIIARKVLGLWFEFWSINRYNDDPFELFHRTRDRYRKMWGSKNVRLRLYWSDEYYDGNGKPIF